MPDMAQIARAAALGLMAALAASAALAQDQQTSAGLRAYLAIPFSGPSQKTPSRLGVQFLTSWDDGETSARQPFIAPQLETALDLAFSRRGLDKFEVMGADARGTYRAAANWLGIEINVPEECETTYRCQQGSMLHSGSGTRSGVSGDMSGNVTGALSDARLSRQP